MPFFERNKKISIFYLDKGPLDAISVLLIPGITCDLHDWNWQVPFLLEHGFCVITPDPRGQGCSSAPTSTPNIRSWPGPDSDPTTVDYYPQSAAQDFVALLGHLNISSVTLVAHSLGTAVAYHLASVRPDLTRALVIFDALHSVPSATAHEYLTDPKQVLQNLVMLFGEALHPPTVPAWHNMWVGRRAAQGNMDVVLAQCWACLGDPNGIGRREVSLTQHDGKIKCPRLTLANSAFGVSTEKSSLSRSTELDEIHLVEGAGHWFFQLRSDEVNNPLKKWLVKIGVL